MPCLSTWLLLQKENPSHPLCGKEKSISAAEKNEEKMQARDYFYSENAFF